MILIILNKSFFLKTLSKSIFLINWYVYAHHWYIHTCTKFVQSNLEKETHPKIWKKIEDSKLFVSNNIFYDNYINGKKINIVIISGLGGCVTYFLSWMVVLCIFLFGTLFQCRCHHVFPAGS